jgi:hypothetical protein
MYKQIKKRLPSVKRDQVEFYDSAKSREWVNQYASVAAWVHEQRGLSPGGFQTVC